MFEDRVIMVLGGSGKLGRNLCQLILQRSPELKKLIIYSRSKTKQRETAHLFKDHPKLKFYLGDIRHRKKLAKALKGVDYLINAIENDDEQALLSPYDYLRRCLDGTQSLIEAALEQKVGKVLSLSTYQACNPSSVQGLAQRSSEMLLVAANEIARQRGQQTQFSVLRYGKSITGQEGIVNRLRRQQETGCLILEDINATSFWFTLEQGAVWVLKSLAGMRGGEIFVPQIPSIRLLDLAKAICPHCQLKVEEGRKSNFVFPQVLITQAEGLRTLECKDHYVIQPDFSWWNEEEYAPVVSARHAAEGFLYSSAVNNYTLSGEELQFMVRRRGDG